MVQIIEEMLDVKNYVRKPQYIMASETPLLLFQCGYEGLSFHIHPGTLIVCPFYATVLHEHN